MFFQKFFRSKNYNRTELFYEFEKLPCNVSIFLTLYSVRSKKKCFINKFCSFFFPTIAFCLLHCFLIACFWRSCVSWCTYRNKFKFRRNWLQLLEERVFVFSTVFFLFFGIGRDVFSVFVNWSLIGFERFCVWGFLSCLDFFEFIEFFKLDDTGVDATRKKLSEIFPVSNFFIFVFFLIISSEQ